MANYTQDKRLMQFTSPAGTDRLLAQSLEGRESFSQLFDYNLTCLADVTEGPVDVSKLLGAKVTLQFTTFNTSFNRYINGIVASMEQSAGDVDFDVYELRIVPALWQLTLSYDCRIFNDKSPMEIIQAVIQPYGIKMQDKTENSAGLPKLEYCTQFNESDYNFVCRVAERYGIFFWFEHTQSDHTVVFANNTNGYTQTENVLRYAPNGSDEGLYDGVVSVFRCSNAMVTGKHSSRVSDFRAPNDIAEDVGPDASKQTAGKNMWERYTYPAEGAAAFKATSSSAPVIDKGKLATLLGYQRAASDMPTATYHGVSNATWLANATILDLNQHPRQDWNVNYMLIDTTLIANQSPAYQSGTSGGAEGVRISFTAIKSTTLYVPEARTPRPRIAGPQPAIVSALDNKILNVDSLGRVNVQFMWERNTKDTDNNNCWVRVAQQWAGFHRGSFFWPRSGDEVLVSFLNGDPDDPIVIGSLYNHLDNVSYKLPDHQTRSGWISNTLEGTPDKQASSFWIEDAKGKEEVHLHAERNLNISVESASTRIVGGDETIGVYGDQGTHIKKNVVRTVQQKVKEKMYDDVDRLILKNLTEEVKGDVSVKVDGQEMRDVGTNYGLQAGRILHIKAGMNVVIEADATVQLKVGGNFIQINTAGIAISGTMVLINSGGAALGSQPIETTAVSIKDAPSWIMDPDLAAKGDPPPSTGI